MRTSWNHIGGYGSPTNACVAVQNNVAIPEAHPNYRSIIRNNGLPDLQNSHHRYMLALSGFYAFTHHSTSALVLYLSFSPPHTQRRQKQSLVGSNTCRPVVQSQCSTSTIITVRSSSSLEFLHPDQQEAGH